MKNFLYHWKTADNWPTLLFLLITPVVALFGTLLWLNLGLFNMPTLWLSFIFLVITGTGITAGYHRLFSHRAYEANRFVQWYFMLAGGAAWQGSVIEWSLDHRVHHQKIDSAQDPYNINEGFGFAHFYWLFHRRQRDWNAERHGDLVKDKMLLWQDRYYSWIAALSSFVLPMAIAGIFWGDWLGGLIIAGVLRTVINHHLTFAINSVCHVWGKQPYSDKHSARDNWFTAFFTWGEGFHNFHHEFATDYRNAIQWYQFDPSKWLIWALSKLGIAWNLKRTPEEKIFARKMNMQEKKITSKIAQRGEALLSLAQAKLNEKKEAFQAAANKLTALRKRYQQDQPAKKAMRRAQWKALKNRMAIHSKELKEAFEAYCRAAREVYNN